MTKSQKHILAICDGAPKSGSAFLFTLIRNILLYTNRINAEMPEKTLLTSASIEYTGFYFPPSSINDATASLLTKSGSFCVKTHSWDTRYEISLPYHVFCSARDPFDNALSLYEQFLKEQENSNIQKRFTNSNSLATCLSSTMKYMNKLLLRKKNSEMSVFIYPEFILPSDAICFNILDKLGLLEEVNPASIREIAAEINRSSREGTQNSEFNKGIEGRGQEMISQFPSELKHEAIKLFEEVQNIAIH